MHSATINFVDIKKALRAQDEEQLREIIPEFIQGQPDKFDQVLQQMLFVAATEKPPEGPPLGVVYLDSVRDLATLYEGEPTPVRLMDRAIQYFSTLNLEDFDKDVNRLLPEDMSELVFVDDFEEYVREGEREKAVHEAVKLLVMMDNQFYLVEILTEIAASTTQHGGLPLIIAGSVLKSVDFVDSAQFKTLIYQLTDYLSGLHIGWDEKSIESEADGEVVFPPYYQAAFQAEAAWDIIYLTYAQQIWDGARMKVDSLRKYIQRYMEDDSFLNPAIDSSVKITPEQGTVEDIANALRDNRRKEAHSMILGYARNGGLGTLYRKFTDLFLESGHASHSKKLILLNAYRTAIAYLNPPEQYHALLKASDLIQFS
ncbi:MAG: hypothetical protein GF372_07635 [Candidatus Marinimicrobia bacterium]|nr:hypothetical protein [Candidatus Neomarinimicrobiota bacterium]